MTQYYDSDPCDTVDVRTLSRRIARTRTARVLPCGHHVGPGTRYTRWVGVIDGEFSSVTECDECLTELNEEATLEKTLELTEDERAQHREFAPEWADA